MTEQTVRLSVGQAIVRYLTHQYTERDGVEPVSYTHLTLPTKA